MVASYYAWDPEFDCITKEIDESDANTVRYTQEPKPYGGLISQRRGSTTRYYHYDNIGTTRALTNQAGSPTDRTTYTAFGELVDSTGATVNPFGFVGRAGYLLQGLSGRLNVRHRDLIAANARWASIDPIQFSSLESVTSLDFENAPIMNGYVYGDNRPLIYLDPSGLICKSSDCGTDVTEHLVDLYGQISTKFKQLVANRPESAKRACHALNNIAWFSFYRAWDTYELAHEKGNFVRPGCGRGHCEFTVTVNKNCYKPEHVNYYLWGLINKLCFGAGYARTVTGNYSLRRCYGAPGGPVACRDEWYFRWGEFTLESALDLVTSYRGWLYFEKADDPEVIGRKEWTEAGYAGRLSAPAATVQELFGLNCLACRKQHSGRISAYFGENAGRGGGWFWSSPLEHGVSASVLIITGRD
jgi:RHS repeat-associated protein